MRASGTTPVRECQLTPEEWQILLAAWQKDQENLEENKIIALFGVLKQKIGLSGFRGFVHECRPDLTPEELDLWVVTNENGRLLAQIIRSDASVRGIFEDHLKRNGIGKIDE
ncbi:MAG: hypothetical protein Q8P67_26980 [archaeon]|nr:hypothetical protein [archaeon]